MDPVSQGLPIHATDASCLFAIYPLINRRNRQQSPCLVRVLHSPCQNAQLIRTTIIAKRNCRAHLWLPNQCIQDRNESRRSAIPKR
jgi:hypothetical protein